MVREWTVAQRTFLVEKKMQGADLAQIITDEAWLTHFFHFFLLGETSSILGTFLGQEVLGGTSVLGHF